MTDASARQTDFERLDTSSINDEDNTRLHDAASFTLTYSHILAFGVAAYGPGLLISPITIYIPQLYAKEYGISLASLGVALVFIRIFSAFTDQIVGYLSDNTRTRWGARKPWIFVGVTAVLIAAYFLMRPPPAVGLLYLIVWKVLYDIGHSMFDVNHAAWGAELSGDYNTRSRITGTRGFFLMGANITNDFLPIFFAGIGLVAASVYSIEVMGYIFIVALIFAPLVASLALLKAPQGEPMPSQRFDLKGFFTSIRRNKPLWIYLTSFGLAGMGMGLVQLTFTFYDGYLNLGPWYPYMMLTFAISMAGFVPVWTKIALRFGKHRPYVVGIIIAAIRPQAFWFIDPQVMPQDTILVVGFIVMLLLACGSSASLVMSPAILADIVDYGRLKTGEKRTGGYFAFYMLTAKIAFALGGGLGFVVLDAFNYDATAGAINTGWAAFGILFVVCAMPAIFKVTGAILIWNFPIDARRHSIIRRRLDSQIARNTERSALIG